MNSVPPFVSVIVAAPDADGLRECLASLSAVDYPAARREVLVVGGDRSRRVAELAGEYACRYLSANSPSVTAARNRGIEESRGEIVAFTDPDCVVSTGWLRRLVEAFAEPGVGAVAGGVVPYPPRTLAERYMARRRSHAQERPISHAHRPFAMTPNLALRREVFDNVGLFDTRFPGGGWEDADLCWRFSARTSLRLVYAPRAAVFHRYRSTVGDFLVQQHRYGYGLGLLVRKYRSELPHEWHERAGSLRELGAAVTSLVGAAVRAPRSGGGTNGDLGFRCFDVLRQVGQRSGYWAASLSRR